jgi:hypothetical protein
LFSKFSFGELYLSPLPWSHISAQNTHKHQQNEPSSLTLSPFPHSPFSLPLSTRKNKIKREKRGEEEKEEKEKKKKKIKEGLSITITR